MTQINKSSISKWVAGLDTDSKLEYLNQQSKRIHEIMLELQEQHQNTPIALSKVNEEQLEEITKNIHNSLLLVNSIE